MRFITVTKETIINIRVCAIIVHRLLAGNGKCKNKFHLFLGKTKLTKHPFARVSLLKR